MVAEMKPPLGAGDTGQTGSSLGAGGMATGKGPSARPVVSSEGWDERSYQAFLPAGLPDGAQVHPQGLLLQGRLGDGHPEHIIEEQGLRSWVHFRSKQAADVTWGGKQSNPEIPAKSKDDMYSPVQWSWLRSWCLKRSSRGRSAGDTDSIANPRLAATTVVIVTLGGSEALFLTCWCPWHPGPRQAESAPALRLQQRPWVGKWGGRRSRSGQISYCLPASGQCHSGHHLDLGTQADTGDCVPKNTHPH